MEEESSSWIRRIKFSHTVCYSLDSGRLSSLPIGIPDRVSGLKSRPGKEPGNPKSGPSVVQIQRIPSTNKQRTVSPLHQTMPSDAFKEAKSDRKRFSTPHPRRKEPAKGIMGRFFRKDIQENRETKAHDSKSAQFKSQELKLPSNACPLRHFDSMKVSDKAKGKKESPWTKYFDYGRGRVTAVEAADEHMVDLSKLFLGHRFAHGAHSHLYHGKYIDEHVAVKIIRAPDDDEDKELAARLEKQFNREVALLSRLHHPNVIKFVAACRKPPVFCIVAEYLSEGSLRAFLHKIEPKSLPLEKIIAIALEVAHGMEYIHSQGVIHRDLKPENILIGEDFHLKIADFGIACEEAHCDLLADDPGTYRWMAPEMIKRKSYCRKVDVYGFGLILWELVAGAIPYEDMSPIQAAFAVVNKNLRPAIPLDCPPPMRALIEQCWSLQPDKRPEFGQVVKVLELFETSLALDGTLNLVQCPLIHDHHKKGPLKWIQKLGPVQPNSLFVPKPKVT